MTKMTKLALTALLGFAVLSTTASADSKKGQKLYMKTLKAPCGMSGSKFAATHTQDEWEEINTAGKFEEEVKKICPKASMKPAHAKDIYDFAYEFASDSGNVPSC
ncbi:MAG TPA: cytochrome C [Sulfurovum sp. UBA12169]|nr:MAG TPA: cytochrome C [Sulfurovum sp. UBA12169]